MRRLLALRGPLAAIVLAGVLMGGTIYGATTVDLTTAGQHTGQIAGEMEQLTNQLHLTRTQRKQVLSIILQRHEEVMALFDQHPTLTRKALAPNLRAIRTQTSRAINAVLTDRQKALVVSAAAT